MASSESGTLSGDDSAARSELTNSALLYHHYVIPSQQVLHAVEGSFTVPNAHDVVIIRPRHLELWALHPTSHHLQCIHSVPLFTDVFAAVAVATGVSVQGSSHASFMSSANAASRFRREDLSDRLSSKGAFSHPGGELAQSRDGVHYLAVTSETGYVTLLRYEMAEPPVPTQVVVGGEDVEGGGRGKENDGVEGASTSGLGASSTSTNTVTTVVVTSLRGRFVKVSEVLLGRSGVRATVPGMRMTVGENGSALFISAFMRSKVVVPIHRTHDDVSDWRSLEEMEEEELGEGESDVYGKGSDGEEEESKNFLFGKEEEEESEKKDSMEKKRRRVRSGLARGAIKLGNPIEVHRQTVIYSICAIEGSAETALFAALEEEIAEVTEEKMAAPTVTPLGSASLPPALSSNTTNNSSSTSTGAFIKMPTKSENASPSSTPNLTRRKMLVVYAYVASLNQVQRTHLIYPPSSAHRLISLPAAPVGPGGVIVCTNEEIVWYDVSTALTDTDTSIHAKSSRGDSGSGSTGIFRCATPFPRRVDFQDITYDPSIISHALTVVRKADYFLLLQDEHGDVYRVSISNVGVSTAKKAFQLMKQHLAAASKGKANGPPPAAGKNPLVVHYYETLPCARAMILFRVGFLLVASDGGAQHGLFRVKEGYTSEKEYMVRRIKTVVNVRRLDGGSQRSLTEAPEEKHGTEVESSSSSLLGGGDVPHLPPPSSFLPLPSSVSKAPSPALPPSRTIVTFHPHQRLKHVDFVQHFTNTPPIVGLCCTIPGAETTDGGSRSRKGCIGGGVFSLRSGSLLQEEEKEKEAPEHQQQQVQLTALCGRGPQGLLLEARYGYSTKEIRRVDLPGTFVRLFPLSSSTSLQHYHLLQLTIMQEVREASRRLRQRSVLTGEKEREKHMSGGSGRAHSIAGTIKRALSALAMLNSQYAIGSDKVVLSSLKTTAAFSIGANMEPDGASGFDTSQRTLAVSTIDGGRGYIQVTPTALHIIPSPFSATPLLEALHTTTLPAHYPPLPLVEATKWVHPGGRSIIAAAVTSRSAVLSFAGGGLASFHFQHPTQQSGGGGSRSVLGSTNSLWRFTQRDMVATFPTVSAVSLLQSPLSAVMQTASSELRHFLALQHTASSSSSSSSAFAPEMDGEGAMYAAAELVAVTTVGTKEVQLFHPSNLRQPLEVIRFPAGMHPQVDITATFLTYMNDGMESMDGNPKIPTGGTTEGGAADSSAGLRSVSSRRRVFCFVGYADGTLVRCELDSFSAKVIDRQELSCGAKPCQIHAGDGETVCYIQSGEQCWRCALRGGVAKVMPWRFPSRQSTFGYFLMPRRPMSIALLFEKILHTIQRGQTMKGEEEEGEGGGTSKGNKDGAADEGKTNEAMLPLQFVSLEMSGVGGGSGSSRGGSNEEYVMALRDRQLFLFSSSLMDSGASSNSLEYSLITKMLPLAGRRIIRHPTQPSYLLIAGTEHRFHRSSLLLSSSGGQAAVGEGGAGRRGPLLFQKRSLGKPEVYQSCLQLYHEETNSLLPPQFLSEGEAIMSAAMGCFFVDMGKESILVVGVARMFSHGTLCGSAPTYKDGLLRAYRFVPNTDSRSLDPRGKPFLRLEPLHHTFVMDFASGSSSTGSSAMIASPSTSSCLPDYPSALCVCEEVGLLLVGLGKENGLRLYSYGRSQFLRKRCLANVPARITAIQVMFVKPSSGVPDQSYFVSGLYQCPVDNSEVLRVAREKQMLIVCGTEADSVFIAALQPGSRNSIVGFLMIIARDSVPRFLSCMTIINESTICVADKFGTVAFLAIPRHTRTGFAEPIDKMTDTEVDASMQHFATRQLLQEIAVHHTGALVTSLNVQTFDPSGGEDPSLTTNVVYYGTTLGSVGCYTPFMAEEDGALAAYLRPLLREHMRLLLYPGVGQLPYYYLQHHSGRGVHNVMEGQWLEAFRQPSSTSVFSVRQKEELEDRLERIQLVEAARRSRLGLLPRKLPAIDDLIAKQRALSTLPL